MRLSEYCTSQDVDRAIAVTVDSFVGAQKVSCRKALGRAFAKYVSPPPLLDPILLSSLLVFTRHHLDFQQTSPAHPSLDADEVGLESSLRVLKPHTRLSLTRLSNIDTHSPAPPLNISLNPSPSAATTPVQAA